MSFQDNQENSVQSLLALLRSTQDGAAPSAASQAEPSTQSTSRTNRTLSRSTSGNIAPGATAAGVPSGQQLNDLLRTLNGTAPPSATPSNIPPISPGPGPRGSRNLIEPFGPITDFVNPSAIRRTSGSKLPENNTGNAKPAASRGDGEESRVENEDRGTMTFAKALPKLGEMMGDERFMLELRKMKADQDALERRMWAKQEKIKAEHERSIQAERDIARIAQRPIPAEKRAQWAANLDLNLRDFHLQTCLPSLDSLSKRQKDRLEELGVPGLGGDGSEAKTVARWRKIMDLLQAGLGE